MQPRRLLLTSLTTSSALLLAGAFSCSPIQRDIEIVDDDGGFGGSGGQGGTNGGAGETSTGGGGGGTGPRCTANEGCASTPLTPVCDDGRCVGCRNDDDCDDSSEPVCSPSGRCVECVENADCASQACGPNDRCLEPETAVYALALTGSNSTDCGTRELPCLFIDAALEKLTEERPNLILVPTNQAFEISTLLTISQTFPITVYGNGVRLNVNDRGIDFVGGELSLRDVHLRGFGTSGMFDGYVLLGCSGNGVLHVEDSRFENSDVGIQSSNCHVTVRGSRFTELVQTGVSTTQGCVGNDGCVRDVLVERSFFEGMESAVDDSTENALIENNVIRNCGTDGYNRCLDLRGAGTVVRYNTILDSGNCTYTGLFACDGNDLVLSSNITYRSTLSVSAPGDNCYDQVYLSCTTNGSSIDHALSEAAFPGTGNITGDPLFVDADGGDYRLQEDSPAVDAGAEDGPDSDFDGFTRPVGGGFDIGAFERR